MERDTPDRWFPRPDKGRLMRAIEIGAITLCFAGTVLWVYGYFVSGHPSLLNWNSFSPSWISEFLPNLESEIGMVASFAGMIAAIRR